MASALVITLSVSVSHLQYLPMIPNHLEEYLIVGKEESLNDGNVPRPEGKDERRVEGKDWAMAYKPEAEDQGQRGGQGLKEDQG